ncbi:MAG: hypothetical protein HXX10_00680 [Rhodoplanes sp.]|uniref:hypothetical protein n=1 Tax=Rhodoplanes sp. TaxID=1968906 RepID=UPI001831AA1A|nr:hypothetical protein [Rhodoplanes sp.]NVO12530.1 hypothetical protein [Rhodoplanes sp.]
MSDTVLGFWDFFWIWWIVAVLGGGTSYLSSRDKPQLEKLEQQIAALTEEIRSSKGGGAAPADLPDRRG